MEACSSYFLPRLIGHSNANYLLGTGGVFPPTAKHFGDLFNEILPEPSQVLPRALELATEMAENVSPTASYLNRALLWRDNGSPEAAHLVESKVIYHMFGAACVGFDWNEYMADDVTGTRRKASSHSLRSASPTLKLILTMIRRRMFPGGPRLTRAVVPRRHRSCRIVGWHIHSKVARIIISTHNVNSTRIRTHQYPRLPRYTFQMCLFEMK